MTIVTLGKDHSEGDLTPEQQKALVTIMNKWMQAMVELTPGGQRTLAVNIAAFYMKRHAAPIEEFLHDVETALDDQK